MAVHLMRASVSVALPTMSPLHLGQMHGESLDLGQTHGADMAIWSCGEL